jgi:hypothetical protein
LTGFTDNYIKIELKKDENTEGVVNWILPVELNDFNNEGDVISTLAVSELV